MLLQVHHLAILHLLLVGTDCKDFLIETKDEADLADVDTPSKGAKSADIIAPMQADVYHSTAFSHDLPKPAKAPSPKPDKATSPKPAKAPSPKLAKALSPKPAKVHSPKPAKTPSPKTAKATSP